MIKIRSNLKLCDEEIIPKFNRLIALYNFTVISGFQLSYSPQLTVYNAQQLFSQLTDHNSFFYNHSQTKQTLSTPMSCMFMLSCPEHLSINQSQA
jgi:hypothetical protein